MLKLRSAATFFPLVVGFDEVAQAVGFHLVVIDDVDAEVQQVLGVLRRRGDERADVELEAVQRAFGDVARAIYKAREEVVLLERGHILFRHDEVAAAAFVELNIVHSKNK